MKRGIIGIVILLSAWVASAQKASAENQEKIISQQDEMAAQMQALMEGQEKLINLYGGEMDPNNRLDQMSYAYGLSVAENLKAQGADQVNIAAFMKGMTDVLLGQNPQMTPQEAQQIINEYMTEMKQMKAKEAKSKGEAFLAENAKRSEVKTTDSGLQYEVIKEGKGEQPTAKSKVTVHYEGTTIDGQIFDSSKQRGQPATFGLSQVIKGWTEGLQLMKPGAVYKLYIPSELAYGDRGAGQAIGPGETLIFEVELISIN